MSGTMRGGDSGGGTQVMPRRLAPVIGMLCCIVAVAYNVQLRGAAPQTRSARPPQAPADGQATRSRISSAASLSVPFW